MRTDPFYSAKSSIGRAKHHFTDLKRQSAVFFQGNPYAEVDEIDPDTGKKFHKVKLVKPMPIHLEGIAVDTLNNLRNALDQSMFAFVRRFQYFPIFNSQDEFEQKMIDVRKKLPREICDMLTLFKPYKGGNDLLWVLNKINNSNKHGIIRPVAIGTGGLVLTAATITGPSALFAPRWDRTKNEMVIAELGEGATYDATFNFTTYIAISDVEIIDGQPVEAVLGNFIHMVESIVMALEVEAKRIGLLNI